MKQLRCVCAVCKVQYGVKPCLYEVEAGKDITHGLCEKHLAEANAEVDALIRKQKEKGK